MAYDKPWWSLDVTLGTRRVLRRPYIKSTITNAHRQVLMTMMVAM